MIECRHYDRGECKAGHYDRPSPGVCLLACTHYDGPPRSTDEAALVQIRLMLGQNNGRCGSCGD